MIVDSPTLDDCIFHAAPVENEAPGPTYSPQPSNERQQATMSVINAANITPAPPAAPVFQQSVDEYEDQALRAMKAHWVIPAGVPGGALTPMSFDIAADGRVYDAMVKTPSGSTDLDKSCLDALNGTADAAYPDRPGARSGFQLSCDAIKLNHLSGLFDEGLLPLLFQRQGPSRAVTARRRLAY